MDNSFFQILIWIFIIAIILSSLLKKKPQETQEKKEGQIPVPRGEDPRYRRNIESYNEEEKEFDNEVQSEIENLFKIENTGNTSPAKKETKIETYNRERQKPEAEEIPDEYSGWPGTPKPQSQRTIAKDVEKIASEVKQMDSKIEQQAMAFEKFLNKSEPTALREEKMGMILSSLREKIKNPLSLREYIVINEIIGKPIGLKNRKNYFQR